eukprot:m.486277 g.486277  ORF g.486277 m.486277 type:complete len:294 (+) comp24282_c0_seq1:346-1227(+)
MGVGAGVGLGAAATVGALSYLYGGNVLDQVLDWHLRRVVGAVAAAAIDDTDSAVPGSNPELRLRPELLREVQSVARRMMVPADRLWVYFVPLLPSPASTGTIALRSGHGMLLLDCGVEFQYRVKPSFPAAPLQDTQDIAPDAMSGGFSMSPEARYTVAHELAHVRLHHTLLRFGAQSILFGSAVGLAPLLVRTRGWRPKAGAVASMWAIVPAFFASQALSRHLEHQADAVAVCAGYGRGAVSFWGRRVAMEKASGRPASSHMGFWKSHPSAQERLDNIVAVRRYLNQHKPKPP